MISVKLFARIREELGIAELAAPDAPSVSALIAALAHAHGPHWSIVLQAPQVIVAVNQQVVGGDCPLAAGDEVAFFPPVTGG